MTNKAFNITEEPNTVYGDGKVPSSGVISLGQLFAGMDRQCRDYPIIQTLVAGIAGLLVGSRAEVSGWFVGGDGKSLDGELVMAFCIFLMLVWGFIIHLALPSLRQGFYMQFIPQLKSTYLLYLVMEHQSHDKIAPILARDPIFPWITRNRTHEPFSLRIRSFIMHQPAICRALGMADYPANWGRLMFCAIISAGVCLVVSFIVQSHFLQATLWFVTWFLIASAAALRQARVQALSYTIASFFVRWLNAH